MPKTQIKCVLFDYGNVISLHQTLDAKRKQAALACLELSRFRKLWSQYRPSYDQGVIDGREYWSHILRHGRMDSEDARLDELIQADIESWRPVNEWVLEWAQTLRDSGMQTGILLNMPPELVVDTQTMPWIERFQPLFFSAEIKANLERGTALATNSLILKCGTALATTSLNPRARHRVGHQLG